MRTLLFTLFVGLAGCAEHGRYQLAINPSGTTAWRLDTRTGSLEACGFESSTPACHLFPLPATTK